VWGFGLLRLRPRSGFSGKSGEIALRIFCGMVRLRSRNKMRVRARGSSWRRIATAIVVLGVWIGLSGCVSVAKLLRKGNYEGAARLCESESGDEAQLCYRRVADVASRVGRLELALTCYDRAGRYDDAERHHEVLRRVAELRFSAGAFSEGTALLQRSGISVSDAERAAAKWCFDHPSEQCAPLAVDALRGAGTDEHDAYAQVGGAMFKSGLLDDDPQLQDLGQAYLERGGRSDRQQEIRRSTAEKLMEMADASLTKAQDLDKAEKASREEAASRAAASLADAFSGQLHPVGYCTNDKFGRTLDCYIVESPEERARKRADEEADADNRQAAYSKVEALGLLLRASALFAAVDDSVRSRASADRAQELTKVLSVREDLKPQIQAVLANHRQRKAASRMSKQSVTDAGTEPAGDSATNIPDNPY